MESPRKPQKPTCVGVCVCVCVGGCVCVSVGVRLCVTILCGKQWSHQREQIIQRIMHDS